MLLLEVNPIYIYIQREVLVPGAEEERTIIASKRQLWGADRERPNLFTWSCTRIVKTRMRPYWWDVLAIPYTLWAGFGKDSAIRYDAQCTLFNDCDKITERPAVTGTTVGRPYGECPGYESFDGNRYDVPVPFVMLFGNRCSSCVLGLL